MSSHQSSDQSQALASVVKSKLSTIYNLVMTPVLCVSFLASLAWVEFRSSLARSHSHSESPIHLPRWLHRILYQESPYKSVKVDSSQAKAQTDRDEGRKWYYHSKQRKLMKMEAGEAFQIRHTVLVVLGLVTAMSSWSVWWTGRWIWGKVVANFG